MEIKKAIVWGDDKLLKYSKSKLSYLLDEHKAKFLKDIDDSKTHASTGTDDLLKVLGRFLAVVDNTEIDYDFINQDIALNPLFVQIGLFKETEISRGVFMQAFPSGAIPPGTFWIHWGWTLPCPMS